MTLDRRKLIAGTAASTAALLSAKQLSGTELKTPASNYMLCAFVKFIQKLPYQQLAETVADLGFDGIEATVREGGQVLPERVQDDLPKLVEALREHNLEIGVMASSVHHLDQPDTEKVLRTASQLGIKRYRMKYFRYDLNRPVIQQINQIRAQVKDLVALNRELGLQGIYQNHAGANVFGCTIWDLHQMVKDFAVKDLAIAFDIRHATVEGGLAWPVHFNLAQPHLGSVFLKDFIWEKHASKWRIKNVPLGSGQVDPAFAQQLRQSGFQGPISIHVEYLHEAGIAANVAALKRDLATARNWLTN